MTGYRRQAYSRSSRLSLPFYVLPLRIRVPDLLTDPRRTKRRILSRNESRYQFPLRSMPLRASAPNERKGKSGTHYALVFRPNHAGFQKRQEREKRGWPKGEHRPNGGLRKSNDGR